MKLISALFVSLIFSLVVNAQVDVKTVDGEQFRWLYERLFTEQVRAELPAETFKSFQVHLQDSYNFFPDPSLIAAKNLTSARPIEGTITYAGIVKKKYSFELIQDPDALVFNVRIHLQNPTPQDVIDFADKVQQAENIWNESRVSTDFNYKFKFDIVTDRSQAQYSVKIMDSTRGPYDQFWGRDWIGNTLAHEIGHMMGLGDEYQTLSGKFDCYMPSIMCTAWTGHMMPHHYYFILRRLVQNNTLHIAGE